MKRTILSFILAALTGGAMAADPHAGHQAPAKAKDAAASMSEGTIRKIDAASGKVTIAHGPLANLGMPPMTMVFKTRDASILKGFKAGDAVRFVAEQQGDDYVVTRLAARN